MKKLFTIIILASIALISSCGGDDPKPNLVPTALYSRHVTSFYAEAAARGKNLPQITPKIVFTNNKVFAQACADGGQKSSISSGNTIEITDRLAVEQNDNGFEAIIFREYAHLLLDKPYADLRIQPVQGGTSYSNILCQCTNDDFNFNSQRKQALDHLFE